MIYRLVGFLYMVGWLVGLSGVSMILGGDFRDDGPLFGSLGHDGSYPGEKYRWHQNGRFAK